MAKIEAIELTKLKRNVLQEILDACAVIDANSKNELGTKELYKGISKWTIPELNYNSTNTTGEELKRIVQLSTQETSFRRAYAKVYELSQSSTKTPEYSEPTMTPAPKYAVDSNTLTQDQLKQLQEDATAREEKAEGIRVKTKKGVEASLTRQKELYEKAQKQEQIKKAFEEKILAQQQVQESLKDKKVYAKVEVVTPPPIPDENTQKFAEALRISESFRKDAVENIKTKIATSEFGKNLSQDQTNYLAEKSVTDAATAINNPQVQFSTNSQVAILEALTKNSSVLSKINIDSNTTELIKNASGELGYFKNNTQLSRDVFSSMNEDIATYIFGPAPEKINVSFFSQPIDGHTHEINLGDLNQGYTNLLQGQSDVFNKIGSFAGDQVQSILTGQARTFLDAQVARLPADSLISGAWNSQVGQQILSFAGLTESVPLGETALGSFIQYIPGASTFFEGLGSSLGIDFAIGGAVPAAEVAGTVVAGEVATTAVAGEVAAVGTGIVATEAATGAIVAGTTVGVTAGASSGAGIGAAIGAIGGPIVAAITAAIGAFVTWIATKIPWKKVLPVLAGLAGLYFAGPVVGIVAGVGTGILISSVGSVGGITIAGIGAGIAGLLGSLGRAVASVFLSIPVLVTLLTLPIIVVLILFVINSGAYVVPPTGTSFNDTNPYVDIEKTASPAGPFQNTELPLKITYNITVTAKKGPLTNISFKDECSIVSKSGTQTCPSPTTIDTPNSISPSIPYTYTYDETYSGSAYEDSFVVNTFTVTADTTDTKKQQFLMTASIKIGNPPDVCPNGWPIAGHWKITQTPDGPYSHRGYEAMDIGVPIGTLVTSTSTGIATVTYTSGSYSPVYVDVASSCGGKSIAVRYAHLSAVYVKTGQQVTFGQSLGLSGIEGTGPHLHYEFRGGIIMEPPYIPKYIQKACSNDNGLCGYIP